MNYASFDISLAAVIPAILLAVFVFIKDKTEKEPLPFLVLLFGLGAIIFIPAYVAEQTLISFFDRIFFEFFEFSSEGAVTVLSETAHYWHRALCYLVGVGLVEEGLRFLVLFLITRRSKHFNYLFDGLVYAVFLSMGFAAAENVFYAWVNGWDTLLLRSVSSVPSHLFFAITMGCFYTMWHTCWLAKRTERLYAAEGRITLVKPFSTGGWLAAAIILPTLVHGAYRFVGYFSSSTLTLGFYLLTVLLYLACFLGINRMADADIEKNRSVMTLLCRKYPMLVVTDETGTASVTGADGTSATVNAEEEEVSDDA